MIDVRVLGPLVLRVRGQEIPLGPRQRILLLGLLLARGQAVSAVRLADLLWAGGAPEGWQQTLRSHVCHLRRAMGEHGAPQAATPMIMSARVGAASCYALHISRELIDAPRFESLAADGTNALARARFSDAAAVLREGLALWRGQPFADAADQPFVVAESKRLQGLHRATQMARIEADIHLGLHRQMIGELEGMLACWPDDEGLRRLLVTCLCRSERPGEAARVCRTGIQLALDQGLDVTDLEILQQQVLLGSPALRPHRRVHRFLPAPGG